MQKIVAFSDSIALLHEQRSKAMAAGTTTQLRDVRAHSGNWTPDAQFKNARAVMKLSDSAPEHVKVRAEEIKERYVPLGVVFYEDMSELFKAEAQRQQESPATETVEGVDTPGPGTYEDMKPKRERR